MLNKDVDYSIKDYKIIQNMSSYNFKFGTMDIFEVFTKIFIILYSSANNRTPKNVKRMKIYSLQTSLITKLVILVDKEKFANF